MALLFSLLWCALHFSAFILVSHRAIERRERTVFLFHVSSAVALTLVAAVALATGLTSLPVAAGMVALHGVYSLSVLELWSLSEGSYALTMLASLSNAPVAPATLAARFEALGEVKKKSRLGALQRSRLLACSDPIKLTRRGRLVALAVLALRRLAGFESPG